MPLGSSGSQAFRYCLHASTSSALSSRFFTASHLSRSRRPNDRTAGRCTVRLPPWIGVESSEAGFHGTSSTAWIEYRVYGPCLDNSQGSFPSSSAIQSWSSRILHTRRPPDRKYRLPSWSIHSPGRFGTGAEPTGTPGWSLVYGLMESKALTFTPTPNRSMSSSPLSSNTTPYPPCVPRHSPGLSGFSWPLIRLLPSVRPAIFRPRSGSRIACEYCFPRRMAGG